MNGVVACTTCLAGYCGHIDAELARLRDALEREAWQHAACLTIAEGVKDYDKLTAMESEAIRAVRKLRAECDSLAAENRGMREAVERVKVLEAIVMAEKRMCSKSMLRGCTRHTDEEEAALDKLSKDGDK